MLLIDEIPRVMEKKPEPASASAPASALAPASAPASASAPTSPHHSSKAGKAARKERPPASKGHRLRANKTVRQTDAREQKDRKKKKVTLEVEEVKTEDEEDGVLKSSSTVVDVDAVRENARAGESEESLGLLLESGWAEEGLKQRNLGLCEWVLMVLALALILLFLPLSIWFCVKVVREHERAVIFRLGHLLKGRPKGPGLLFYFPFLDVCQKIDIRLKMLKVPPHTVVTKDLVSTELGAVVYYRIENVVRCSTALSGLTTMLQAVVQVGLRDVLAHHNFTQVLLDRKRISQELQVAVDSVACQWGIKVERAEIEDICLPVELQHSLAVEAEAKRQAQIKVIAAEGERAACEALKVSLDSLTGSPAAVQLRLLQLLHTLRSDRPTMVLNLPSDLLTLPPDLSLLPALAGGGGTREGRDSDSPMM